LALAALHQRLQECKSRRFPSAVCSSDRLKTANQSTELDFSQTMPVRDAKAQLAPHLADHNDPPSSSDKNGDTSSLEPDRIWAYPCKHPACPYYGKTWMLQSNFLNHLKDFKIHREEVTTKDQAGRRRCAREWRYESSLEEPKCLPSLFGFNDGTWNYSYRSADGRVVSTSRDQV